MTFEQKVKLSCAIRGINLKDFDELKTPEARTERNRFAEQGLHIKRFEIDSYTCQVCDISGVTLNAHHINSWKHFPEQRFDINNLVSLCTVCHKKFHDVYGNGKNQPNTAAQFSEFKLSKNKKNERQIVYVVAGVSGSGKSWICDQLSSTCKYIKYDAIDKRNARAIIYNCSSDIVLYDPTTHVSSFIRRNCDIFDIKLVVINEEEKEVEKRLIGRGGKITPSIKRRIKRMKNLAKSAVFAGTSGEVLLFLQSKLA